MFTLLMIHNNIAPEIVLGKINFTDNLRIIFKLLEYFVFKAVLQFKNIRRRAPSDYPSIKIFSVTVDKLA